MNLLFLTLVWIALVWLATHVVWSLIRRKEYEPRRSPVGMYWDEQENKLVATPPRSWLGTQYEAPPAFLQVAVCMLSLPFLIIVAKWMGIY